MTGNYADAPGPRMPWDRDGSQAYTIDGSDNVSQVGQTALNALNAEQDAQIIAMGGTGSGYNRFVVLFPELRDIQGYFVLAATYANSSLQIVEWSANTTTGLDGTWTSVAVMNSNRASVKPDYRTAIQAVSIVGAKAIRFSFNKGQNALWDIYFRAFHLYGKSSAPTANIQRLLFWHPTLNQPLSATPAFLDWGDRPRASAATKQVRVKNMSAALTAYDITLGVQALTDATPPLVATHNLSYDGSAFTSTRTIPVLAPGEVSAPITISQSLPFDAVLSLWAQRLYADPGSWA